MAPRITSEIFDAKLMTFNKIRLDEFKTLKTRGKFKCLICNSVYETTCEVVYYHGGCKICSGLAKLTKEKVNSRISHKNIKMIGNYINNRTKTEFQCLVKTCSHKWETLPTDVMRDTNCPKCSNRLILTKENVNDRLLHRNIEVVEEIKNSQTKTLFNCKVDGCGFMWMAIPNSVLRGHGCPKCTNNVRYTEDSLKAKLLNRNIELIGTFISGSKRTTFKCLMNNCGHEWSTTPLSVIHGSGCPQCKLKNEGRIRNYLKEKYGEDQGNKLTLYFNNRKYHIDFCVNGTLIEYNGIQHYKPIKHWGGEDGFKKQQKRDKEIVEYVNSNGLRLIVIPCWFSHEEQYKLLDNL